MSAASYMAPPEIGLIQQRSLVIGVIGVIACVIGAFISPPQFFHSYLLGYLFWIGIVLGCLAILMLQHMTGGGWGLLIRRLLESATRTLPLMLVLFMPVLIGLYKFDLYPWVDHEASVEQSTNKQIYLSIPFFLARTAFYFTVWLVLMYLMNKWSKQQDQKKDPLIKRRLQDVSGPGLVFYGLTVTFAAIDWVMSLEPEWFSTIFGILFIGGQVLSAMSFVIAFTVVLAKREPMIGVVTPQHLHDLGKLLLAFVMLWAYFSFSQFLIIWSGNLPEEISYYTRRLHNNWKYLGLVLILAHFALPFLLLLSRDLKRHARRLGLVASLVVLMRFVDLFWLIGPELHQQGLAIHWLDIAVPVGLGGIWMAFFIWQLKRMPLLPVNDPQFEEAFSHGQRH